MVKQDMEGGLLKDWGKINGQLKGYWIVEGDDIQIGLMIENKFELILFPILYCHQCFQLIFNWQELMPCAKDCIFLTVTLTSPGPE
jgi:hypothetical protein